MYMACDNNRWGVLLCALLCLSTTVLANVERVRKITYVVHSGPPGIYYPQQQSSSQERSRRMSRVNSSPAVVQRQQPLIGESSTHHIRHFSSYSRSSLQQDSQRTPNLQQLQGVNVCGGKCCHGWSKSSGSERCTKPNCSPPCQNGGMCLRPHLCVCKPGTKGKVCEETAAQDTSSAGTGHQGAGAPAPPSRPIPQQAPSQNAPRKVQISPESSHGGQITLALKQKPQIILSQPQMVPPQTRTMNLQHGQTQQFMIKPKYFSNAKKIILGEQSTEGSLPLRTASLDQLSSHFAQLGNQTGRIKVVFTPSICKVTCTKGRCHNNCEKGNTTTLISENGHASDTLTSSNFRVGSYSDFPYLRPLPCSSVICHLPCMNGGQCTSRDKCQCPSSYTGKLCQIPVQNGNVQKQYTNQQNSVKSSGSHVIHSTHTLPLTVTGQQGIKVNFPPNMVNIHVKHPPEASVQFHQVSRVESSSSSQRKESQIGQTHVSYHGVQKNQLPQAGYPNQQTASHVYPVSAKTQLGRCFQETTGTQCGKPLPGLSKQEDCCGTVGTSWGFSKCMKCPKKASHPSYSQYMECPQGYKRINSTFCQGRPSYPQNMECPQGFKRINATFCQDINECYMQGICPNGDCLNTLGSYRCTCKQGFVPDPTYSACVADSPLVSEEKGPCYRLVSTTKQCMHPLSVQLSRQLCCCSVGKAWGPNCEKCPVLGTAAFKEICPGGMGYTVPVLRGPVPVRPVTAHPPIRTTFQPLITREEPIEALSVSHRIDPDQNGREDDAGIEKDPLTGDDRGDRRQPQLSSGVPTIKIDPQHPAVVEKSPPVLVEIAPDVSKSSQVVAPTQVAEVDECVVDPEICGEGFCVNLPVGYMCICRKGYKQNDNQTKCVDIDECTQNRSLCSHGQCENTDGSFLCTCNAGYQANEQGNDCVDVNECLRPDTCPDGLCINSPGSFRCEYCDSGLRMNRRGQCEDIDECLTDTTCPYDRCVNSIGSYTCVSCPEGYRGFNGRCFDINECQEDTSLCANGDCSNLEGSYKCTCRTGYESTSDSKQCIDIDECKLGNLCLNGKCHNTEGSYKCSCHPGYQLSPGKDRCDDIDECQNSNLCDNGQCRNTRGSFTCLCDEGYKVSAAGDQCEECGVIHWKNCGKENKPSMSVYPT
ncbi:latent-transforming growth factor beta-binding protein 1-like [Hyperolius riggenbachi]|uniref:latent-transforming growth factor beta-binding protein 1-like n=1 Tax=Hyperolius riggenbachi TaxID=752182 RepID=UPI0035A3C92B